MFAVYLNSPEAKTFSSSNFNYGTRSGIPLETDHRWRWKPPPAPFSWRITQKRRSTSERERELENVWFPGVPCGWISILCRKCTAWPNFMGMSVSNGTVLSARRRVVKNGLYGEDIKGWRTLGRCENIDF